MESIIAFFIAFLGRVAGGLTLDAIRNKRDKKNQKPINESMPDLSNSIRVDSRRDSLTSDSQQEELDENKADEMGS